MAAASLGLNNMPFLSLRTSARKDQLPKFSESTEIEQPRIRTLSDFNNLAEAEHSQQRSQEIASGLKRAGAM